MFQRLKNYTAESYNELMHKVSWPTWQELQSSVIVVAVASLVVAILVSLMDGGSHFILDTFYKLFK